jgi:hypothetical protein
VEDGGVDVVEHDVGAGGEEAAGDGAADAAAGAGDEGGAAFEGEWHGGAILQR